VYCYRRRPSAQFLSYLKQKDAPPRIISEVGPLIPRHTVTLFINRLLKLAAKGLAPDHIKFKSNRFLTSYAPLVMLELV